MPDSIDHSKLLPVDVNLSFHERLLDSLHDGVYFVDRERKILYWNKGAELLTGYSADEVVGRSCFDNILMHVTAGGCSLCLDGCPLGKTIEDGKRRESEIFLRHKLGHRVPVSVRAAPITDTHGKIVGAVEVFSDISAKKHVERRIGELEDLVFLDPLTGVPNRRYIELKVKQALQEVEHFGRKIGLMMVDVDHFKQVNDGHGHDAGDQVLKTMCRTLLHNLRSRNVMGRWGGEEFLIILEGTTLDGLRASAERYRMLISETAVPLPAGQLRITVSIGATLMLPDDTDQSVIRRADELMYKSKVNGRDRVTLG
jgi:diguanylate cyclase (GGDEF)-like protein/PAS domain S-box-containing protein